MIFSVGGPGVRASCNLHILQSGQVQRQGEHYDNADNEDADDGAAYDDNYDDDHDYDHTYDLDYHDCESTF